MCLFVTGCGLISILVVVDKWKVECRSCAAAHVCREPSVTSKERGRLFKNFVARGALLIEVHRKAAVFCGRRRRVL